MLLDRRLARYKGLEKLGPAAAPMSKIKNRYRWQIVLKSKEEADLRDILKELQNSSLSDTNGVNVSIDLNPLNML
jgi:primosomal protein N' (replication factor Y)